MSDDTPKRLKQASKSVLEAEKALSLSINSNASGFEQVRLADELRKRVNAYCELIASASGTTAVKLPRPPLDVALVPKRK